MHPAADTVPGVVADDAEATRLGQLLDDGTSVADPATNLQRPKTDPEALLGRLDQLQQARLDDPDRDRDGSIAVESVEIDPEIEREDVAIQERRSPGMPCRISSLTEAQMLAG